eukprot:TRINITY_DN72_c0_g1_i1.p1 TRINITY_DN72_c0_g1~~TRINITY_DN72_c0_g1_i1.p1  ORF type:complete len:367 (-),score=97.43 TRINITY_DN72_c0_g1_i1:2060-3160(-)
MALFLRSASDASMRRVIAALMFFCASSLGAIFVNKACLTHFDFNYPSTLMALQAAVTIILLSLVSTFAPSVLTLSTLKRAHYVRLLPSTLFFVANVTVGLSALSRVNIPMFSAFRRLTVLFVMAAEFVMLHKTHARSVVLSVFVLTFGAFVSALGDVTFTLWGYALVFVNNALTAAYLASIKRVMSELQLDPTSLLYYTNMIAFPIILCIALFTGDLQSAVYRYHADANLRDSPPFIAALSFVAVSAFCVNLSTSICTHITSPLTTSVAGQVKNVLQSLLGFFSWGYVPTPLNVVGLLIALAGQISFAIFKHASSASVARDSEWSTPSPSPSPSPSAPVAARQQQQHGDAQLLLSAGAPPAAASQA